MLNRIILIASFLCCAMSQGQVGFGTNEPSPSSVVDFKADNKGILIPRVVLTDLDNPKIKPADSKSPVATKSLLVYNKGNTDTSGGKQITVEGFYYWDGSKWTEIGRTSPLLFRKAADFTLDKSHHSATLKVDGKRKVIIPDNLPEGFKVTIIGDASERVSILSSVPTIGANPASQIKKNGKLHIIFYKDKDDNPHAMLWGDLDSHKAFITKWEIPAKSTRKNRLTITKSHFSTYNYDIDWGDGKKETGLTGGRVHTYDEGGTYFVTISGTFPQFNLGTEDSEKLQELVNWGKSKWESMRESFRSAKNMKIIAQDVPDLSLVTDMSMTFEQCDAITTIPGLESWDVSGVTDISRMFRNTDNFNQDISGWNPNISSRTGCLRYVEGANKFKNEYKISKFNTPALQLCNN